MALGWSEEQETSTLSLPVTHVTQSLHQPGQPSAQDSSYCYAENCPSSGARAQLPGLSTSRTARTRSRRQAACGLAGSVPHSPESWVHTLLSPAGRGPRVPEPQPATMGMLLILGHGIFGVTISPGSTILQPPGSANCPSSVGCTRTHSCVDSPPSPKLPQAPGWPGLMADLPPPLAWKAKALTRCSWYQERNAGVFLLPSASSIPSLLRECTRQLLPEASALTGPPPDGSFPESPGLTPSHPSVQHLLPEKPHRTTLQRAQRPGPEPCLGQGASTNRGQRKDVPPALNPPSLTNSANAHTGKDASNSGPTCSSAGGRACWLAFLT